MKKTGQVLSFSGSELWLWVRCRLRHKTKSNFEIIGINDTTRMESLGGALTLFLKKLGLPFGKG